MTEPDEDDDDPAFFERVRRGTAALRALMAVRPGADGITGSDASGVVTVSLGAAGLPERIDLDDGWRRAVGVDDFAAAITQACGGAHRARFDATDADSGWMAEVSAVLAYIDGEGPEPRSLPQGEGTHTASPHLPDLSGLLADVVAADLMEDAGRAAEAGPPRYCGSAGAGRLTLTLDATGKLICEADPDWVGRQETRDLRDALASALAGLHAERRAAATSRSPVTRFAAQVGAFTTGYALPS